ncbi:MAG TPA: CocE/NonD family hydrolase, partial [Microthrixaceae bacterium]|nr:CocE/NonD family hydrolase [Microthrixaceae bacterium]
MRSRSLLRTHACRFLSVVVLAAVVTACDPPTRPTALQVRGGVEQLHVVNATPATAVTVAGGPNAIAVSAQTNAEGAYLLRGIEPGPGYTVTVGGTSTEVTVLTGEEQSTLFSLTDGAMPPTSDHYVLVRDGTLLDYRVDLPAGVEAASLRSEENPEGSTVDAVVMYSGYRPALNPSEKWEERQRSLLLAEGYAVVGVNMRGTGCSGGSFDVMEPSTASDGYDVIETLGAQSWVDGVAMAGASWLGLSQLWVGAMRPPSLDAIAPGLVAADFFHDVFWRGGINRSGFALWWGGGRDATNKFPSAYGEPGMEPALPADPGTTCRWNQALRSFNVSSVDRFTSLPEYSSEPPGWRALWPDRPTSYWQDRTIDVSTIEVPTMLVTAWQDEQVGSRPYGLLDEFDPATPVRFVGTNGSHSAYISGDVWTRVAEFLDVYLDGDPVSIADYEAEPALDILLESDDAFDSAVALEMDAPSDAAATTYDLGGELMADGPDPAGTTSTFAYSGGNRAWIESTADDATFTTSELGQNLTLAGGATARLRVRASAPADLQATVSEVRADGQERFVQMGSLRVLPSSPTAWQDV